MITNNDKIGNYIVRIICECNQVAIFQTPTLEDAQTEAQKVKNERSTKNLITSQAYAKQIKGRNRKGFITIGEKIILPLE